MKKRVTKGRAKSPAPATMFGTSTDATSSLVTGSAPPGGATDYSGPLRSTFLARNAFVTTMVVLASLLLLFMAVLPVVFADGFGVLGDGNGLCIQTGVFRPLSVDRSVKYHICAVASITVLDRNSGQQYQKVVQCW